MIAIIVVVWSERNNRIFSHKANSILSLFDSIIFFVDSWAGHLALPHKRKVDTALLMLVRRLRFLLVEMGLVKLHVLLLLTLWWF